MGEEEIKYYEEELFTESTKEGQTTISKKIFTKNRIMDKVNKE